MPMNSKLTTLKPMTIAFGLVYLVGLLYLLLASYEFAPRAADPLMIGITCALLVLTVAILKEIREENRVKLLVAALFILSYIAALGIASIGVISPAVSGLIAVAWLIVNATIEKRR